MKTLVSTILLFCFYLLAHDSAYACSCLRPGPPTEELKRSDAVFSGNVIRINENGDDPTTMVEAVFEVDKVWKGTSRKQVSVFTARHSAACGFNFSTGEKYLVYANRDKNDRLITTICTRTKKLSDAREDLDALGEPPGGSANTSTPNPDRGFIEVDDNMRIFYEKVGKGKQVVVVPLHLFLFEDFKHLAKDKTYIFYDVRNRGRSDAVADASKLTIHHDVEDLEKLRQHFKIEKMSLIGESYVGLMVVMYAMKYPQHIDRLIQIGPVPLKYGTNYPKELTANDPIPIPDRAESAKIDELFKQGYHKTNPKDFCDKDWAVSKFGLVGKPENVSKLRSVCHLSNEWPVNLYRHFGSHFVSVQKLEIPKAEVMKVTVPVLTIHGTRDRNAVYGAGREWVQMLPNARLLTVKEAAHFPWVDDPELVFGSIITFLNGKFPKQAEDL